MDGCEGCRRKKEVKRKDKVMFSQASKKVKVERVDHPGKHPIHIELPNIVILDTVTSCMTTTTTSTAIGNVSLTSKLFTRPADGRLLQTATAQA